MPMLHSPKVCEYRFRMLCKCCNPLHSPPKCKAHCKQKQCTHHPFLPFECIPSVAARFPCFLRNGCRTECLLHRAARNMPPGFRVLRANRTDSEFDKCAARTFGNPRRCSRTAQQHTARARHKPFGKCANSFLVRSLKCAFDRAHLAEHQFAEKLAVIIARCNRFVFGKTSGKRNSQLRKTAVARTPYKPASRSAY